MTYLRSYATQAAGTTPLDGFTIEVADGGYEVSDGATSVTVHDEASALRAYADFIETFADDLDDDAITGQTPHDAIAEARTAASEQRG